VDFLAYYEGYDSDGDGVFRDWHRNYHRESWTSPISIRNHLGTLTSAPFQLTWNTQWIPDQPSGQVKFIARIKDNNDIWFVTDEVSNLTLQRTDFSVKLFKPEEVPQVFWVRDGQVKSSKVNISTLSDATSAVMYVATWNGNDGTDDFYSKVNSWTAPKYGSNGFHSYDQVPVPLSALTSGENLITFSSSTIHHGIEIMWPGPAIVLQFANLVYTPVTPCRIVDTRSAGGAIPPGGIRSYNVWGDVASQGGNPAGCPSPKGEPYTAHINVTVVPLGNGNIVAYPYDSTAPLASLVNYRADAQNIANSATVKTCFNCSKDINIKSNNSTAHVIIDVLGYDFAKP
jgi:hypothetical protein